VTILTDWQQAVGKTVAMVSQDRKEDPRHICIAFTDASVLLIGLCRGWERGDESIDLETLDDVAECRKELGI